MKRLLLTMLVSTGLYGASVDIYRFSLNDDRLGYVVLRHRGGVSGSQQIPSTYNGLPVTSIGEKAFLGSSGLTSITIPDSVTSIGERAFAGCSNLTSITIPDSMTSIGNYAFQGCSGLTSITIPDSVTSIGIGAFSNCESLTSITIPDSVTSIDVHAFASCGSLTSITIPDSVTSIGNYAFYRCSSLTSITIPDGVTSIGKSAFRGCTSLRSVTFKGDSPTLGTDIFLESNLVTVYYDSYSSGWGSIFAGRPAVEISRNAPLMVGIQKQEVGVKLFFNGTSGQSHSIESSTDLENWTILEDQIPASSELIERLYSTDDYSRRFFRVIRTDQ